MRVCMSCVCVCCVRDFVFFCPSRFFFFFYERERISVYVHPSAPYAPYNSCTCTTRTGSFFFISDLSSSRVNIELQTILTLRRRSFGQRPRQARTYYGNSSIHQKLVPGLFISKYPAFAGLFSSASELAFDAEFPIGFVMPTVVEILEWYLTGLGIYYI